MTPNKLPGYTRIAWLSQDERYRYSMRRYWRGPDDSKPILFVMLNPSTATAKLDDATTRKIVTFAHHWGYCSLEVVNLFALRSRHPNVLKFDWEASIGPKNDEYIEEAAKRSDKIIVAWGTNETMGRDQTVLSILRKYHDLYCLRMTKEGKPEHPLYIPLDTPLRLFMRRLPQ